MRVILYPYKMASASVNALAQEISSRGVDVLKVYPDGKYKPREGDIIFNWGNGRQPSWRSSKVYNLPDRVEQTGNKLSAFNTMSKSGVSIPNMTDNKQVAQSWVNDGAVVVVRHKLRGHSGDGIQLVSSGIDNGSLTGIVPDAPLYTQYVKKLREYRVHVFNKKVIHWQQKMVRRDFDKDKVNYQIRNHDNGWIYATEAATPPPSGVITHALAAVETLGLSFGAVDVVYNDKSAMPYVLEVNTAPGLEGITVTTYADAILGECK